MKIDADQLVQVVHEKVSPEQIGRPIKRQLAISKENKQNRVFGTLQRPVAVKVPDVPKVQEKLQNPGEFFNWCWDTNPRCSAEDPTAKEALERQPKWCPWNACEFPLRSVLLPKVGATHLMTVSAETLYMYIYIYPWFLHGIQG